MLEVYFVSFLCSFKDDVILKITIRFVIDYY
jgi:hypothetical protein